MVTRGDDFDDFVRGSSTRLLRTAVLLTGDRYDGGAWSPARSDALLVPTGPKPEVKVEAGGKEEIVTLR